MTSAQKVQSLINEWGGKREESIVINQLNHQLVNNLIVRALNGFVVIKLTLALYAAEALLVVQTSLCVHLLRFEDLEQKYEMNLYHSKT